MITSLFGLLGRNRGTFIPGNFTFNLASSAKVSAGVYDSANTLVRTLFSLKPYSAGTFTEYWDGNDDFQNAATNGPFTIKIVSGNATYTWEGVIGNTSTNLNGNTVLRTSYPPRLCANGSTVYWAIGYSEAWPQSWKTTTGNLNSKTWINLTLGGGIYQTDFVCSDGTTVYWAGYDPTNGSTHSFIYGTKNSDDTYQTFSSGVSLPQGFAPTLNSVINYVDDSTGSPFGVLSYITGLAVQTTGNFLFSTRSGINTLYVLNKTTGALVQTITTITAPGVICTDPSDNLWVAHGSVIEKYTVDVSTGAITTTGFTISLSNVGDITINAAGTQILAADMTTQQVKSYNTSTGALNWTLGTGVSYQTNSTVQDKKFYWVDNRKQYFTFIEYMPDGTFLVGDGQNARIQRFSSDGSTLIQSVSYMGNDYYVYVDPNTPTRLFGGNQALLEFQIDYTQPIASSWVLKNNWGGTVDPTWNTSGFKFPITLSNGRTYGNILIVNEAYVVELVAGGAIRNTGIVWSHSAYLFNKIDTNGDHIATVATGSANNAVYSIKRYPLTGFDGSNNPIWSASASTTSGTGVAVGKNGLAILWQAFKTASGNWIGWNSGQSSSPVTDPAAWGQGYHLGAIAEGGNIVKWGSAPSTNRDTYLGPFPGVGNDLSHWFDSGNGVHAPGGYLTTSGDHIFWTYHGENWKATQTNMFMHLFDQGLGLPVGQFGTNRYYDYNNIITYPPIGRYECLPRSAGNALQGMSCTVSGVLYLWTGDEGDHAGIHRWKIENLNTVVVQTAIYPTTAGIAPPNGIDLLAGLVAGSVFTDGVAGWNRSPTTDHNDSSGIMRTRIGTKNFDSTISPSLELFGNLLTTPQNWWASRTLNNSVALTSWTFSTDVLYDLNITTGTQTHGNLIQILDVNGVEICRFQPYQIAGSPLIFNQIRFNDNVIYSTQTTELLVVQRNWTRLTFSYSAGIITCTYGAYSPVTVSTPWTGGGLMNTPSTLRLYMYTTGSFPPQPNGVQTTLQNANFDKTL